MATKLSIIVLSVLVAALAILSNCQVSVAQYRPATMAGIVNILRWQNTACASESGESGTCLADAECNRRAGINIGACANGYGACCSFKVSFDV